MFVEWWILLDEIMLKDQRNSLSKYKNLNMIKTLKYFFNFINGVFYLSIYYTAHKKRSLNFNEVKLMLHYKEEL